MSDFSEQYNKFIEACTEGFKEIGVNVDEDQKEYMRKNPDLLLLQFDDEWVRTTTINRNRIKQTDRFSKKIQSLLAFFETQPEICRDITSSTYFGGTIPGDPILDMHAKAFGDVSEEEAAGIWPQWTQGTLIFWLTALKNCADHEVELFNKHPLKSGSPKRLELALLKALEGYYWHIVGEKPTCNKDYPRTTKFSKVVQYVFDQFGLGVSDEALEQFINRNLSK